MVVALEEAIARYEADEEVQDLLTASLGGNLGVDFLPGSFGFDSGFAPDPEVAARVLWLDALTANVDRSWRNPNLLLWHGDLFAIDHAAPACTSTTAGPAGSARRPGSPRSRTTRATTCWPASGPECPAPTPTLAPLLTR